MRRSIALLLILAICVCGLTGCKKKPDSIDYYTVENGEIIEISEKAIQEGKHEFVIPAGYELDSDLFKGDETVEKVTFESPKSGTKSYNKGITSAGKEGEQEEPGMQDEGHSEIPFAFFFGCTNLKSVTLQEDLEELPGECFVLSGIETVTFPAYLEAIDERCFAECYNLKIVDLSRTALDSIQEYAFQNCHGLKDIYIPGSVTWITSNAFDNETRSADDPLRIHVRSGSWAEQYYDYYKTDFTQLIVDD